MRGFVIAVTALVAALVVVETFTVRVASPIPLNYVEGFSLVDARALAEGAALYTNPSVVPWTLHVYTPLYTVAVGGLAALGFDGLVTGRLLSYGAVLATAFLIGVSGRRRSGWIAWAVAALYLTQPLLGLWGAVVRPDTLAVFFSALGVVCVGRNPRGRGLFFAAFFFLLALLAKQSVGLGLLAAILYLAWTAPRRAIGLVSLCAVGGLLAGLVLEVASGGWFTFHTFYANLAAFSWTKAGVLELAFLRHHWPGILVAILVLGHCVARRHPSIFALWFAAAAISTLAVGRIGADTNYFLETLAAAAFLVAHEWPRRGPATPNTPLRWSTVLLSILTVAVAIGNWQVQRHQNAWIEQAYPRFDRAINALPPVNGPVISDDAGLLIALDKPLLFRPFVMTQLAYNGDWDSQPVIDLLEARKVALVVFTALPGGTPGASRYTPEMREALARNYRRVGRYRTFANFEIYAPRVSTVPKALPDGFRGHPSSPGNP